ncbi:MAG TPA: hypothetical protein VGH80_09980 [Xanthomonadaceae bacterium]|jgi:hypothetical protein
MYDDDRWLKRRRGSGSLLVLFLIAVLGYPLWHWRGLGHPLAGETRVDLCARLAPVPALSGLHAEGFPDAGAAGACRWSDDDGKVQLDAALSTTRSSGGQDLDHLFDTWRGEVKAADGPAAGLVESGEENARVLSYHTLRGRERLVEDHGILLDMRSETMDDGAVDALIQPVRLALRTDPAKAR